MTKKSLWILTMLLLATTVAMVGCGGDDDDDGNNNQNDGDEEMVAEQEEESAPVDANVIALADKNIGAPCTEEADCNKAVCLTPETARSKFHLEGDAEFEIPGGYCTTDLCTPGGDLCPTSEGAYCLSVEPIMGVPGIGLCLRLCNTDEDCAPDSDQVCVGADEFGFTEEQIAEYYADTGKVCLPGDVYDIAVEEVEYIQSLEE